MLEKRVSRLKTSLIMSKQHLLLMFKSIRINLNVLLTFEVIHKVIGFFILLPLLNQLIDMSLHIRSLAYLDLNVLKTYIYYPQSLLFVIIAILLFMFWLGLEYIYLVNCFKLSGSSFKVVLKSSQELIFDLWKNSKGMFFKTILAYFIVFMVIYFITVYANFTVFTLAINVIKQNTILLCTVISIILILLWWTSRWLYLFDYRTTVHYSAEREKRKWNRRHSLQTILFCFVMLLLLSCLFFALNLLVTSGVYLVRERIYYGAVIGVKTIVRQLYSGLVFIIVPPLLISYMNTFLIQSTQASTPIKASNLTKGVRRAVILFVLAYFFMQLYDSRAFFTMESIQLKQPLAIAHRGLSIWAPGNSVSSINEAIEAQADYIELDVQVSSDGIPVLFHDGYLSAANTNSSTYNLNRLKINEVTYDNLQLLTLKTYFPEIYQEKIISLEDALSLLNKKAGLMLEIKTDHPEELQTILQTLARSGFESDLYISSFDINTLEYFKTSSIECKTNLLLTGFVGDIMPILANPDVDALAFEYAAIQSPLVKQVHAAHKNVFVWTLNEPEKMVRTIFDGVDGIITDDPSVVKFNFYPTRRSEFNQLFNVIAN